MKPIPVRHITSAPKDPSPTGRFSIRTIEDLLNGSKLVHELHKHDFFFVLAVQQGSGTHEIDFTQYNIQDHSIFILRPGQAHRLELAANSTGFIVEFDNAFYQPRTPTHQQRWLKASHKQFCAVTTPAFHQLQSLLANMHLEFTTQPTGYLEAIQAYLDLFFLHYIRQSRNPGTIPRADNGYSQDRFEELQQLLDAQITRLKSTSQYAELMRLSPYQLNAITKSAVGKTVSELINDQIILEAKRHLLATHHQVKEIADHLGYEDISYFIRFFKKHTGTSPDAFRKNFR
ncbi:helix-turn-helix domain-containing protein [Paraflavitalea pollutisoli]|uniref:helix-turn-helix domain-containing protein n=1 Tax=Paraflavitalea pollutisoli TaxID=3034143 RepID=UPI0023ECE2B7|nr:helix-turn-helix transcriptional regulator [Paraflavitalea sp. H1-2-19X]